MKHLKNIQLVLLFTAAIGSALLFSNLAMSNNVRENPVPVNRTLNCINK
jgi:hypothetical protein